jgi:hypothetical protein
MVGFQACVGRGGGCRRRWKGATQSVEEKVALLDIEWFVHYPLVSARLTHSLFSYLYVRTQILDAIDEAYLADIPSADAEYGMDSLLPKVILDYVWIQYGRKTKFIRYHSLLVLPIRYHPL